MENIIDINLGAIRLYDLLNGIIAFIFAALMSFVTTPIVRVIAFKIGAVDVPKDNRRMHKVPTPRLGGLAIVFSFIISLLLFYNISNATLGMIIGALMLVLIGIIDDVKSVRALYRFIIQLAASGIVVSQGVVIEHINILGKYYHFGAFAIPITILWIVALTNAINLIDGLDGLSCGISTISAVSLLVVTILIGEFKIALMLAILVGACLGFLPFNKTPVIFIGFGAEFLGFVLAVVSIQGVFKIQAVATFIIPFLILGVPIFDTVFAAVRRVLTGRHPFSADRGHVHHRLVDMGFTKKQSVRILYAVSALLGVSSVMLITHKIVYAIITIAVALTISAVTWIIFKDEKMKYESGLMSEPDERKVTEENNIDLIEESTEKDEKEFNPAKIEKAER